MQRLDVVHPGEGNLVVAPLAAHQHGDLVVAGALERPVVDRGNAFDHVERIRPWMIGERDLRHAVSGWSLRSGLGHTPTTRAHATHYGTTGRDDELGRGVPQSDCP